MPKMGNKIDFTDYIELHEFSVSRRRPYYFIDFDFIKSNLVRSFFNSCN